MYGIQSVCFHFEGEGAASAAYATLNELGFDGVRRAGKHLYAQIEGNDLTSMLEVAHAHGGQMVDMSGEEGRLTSSAYGMDEIRIPAHVVNEDLIAQEERATASAFGLRNRDDGAAPVDADEFLPDSGTYNHFSGNVHT